MTNSIKSRHYRPYCPLNIILLIALLISAIISVNDVQAARYLLPDNGDTMIGEMQIHRATSEDTIHSLAQQFDLGYHELWLANQEVIRPYPGEGVQIIVPTFFTLPPPPWQGVVINLAQMRLYYFPPPQRDQAAQVITYPIGIGRTGMSIPTGDYQIIDKIKNPSWTMSQSLFDQRIKAGAKIKSRVIPPGPNNPLGAYAIQLNAPGYFIHGTNRPYSVGLRSSRGCFRLYESDIEELTHTVPRNTAVRILTDAYTIGYQDNIAYLDAHTPLNERDETMRGDDLNLTIEQLISHDQTHNNNTDVIINHINTIALHANGVPMAVIP